MLLSTQVKHCIPRSWNAHFRYTGVGRVTKMLLIRHEAARGKGDLDHISLTFSHNEINVN